MDALNWLQLWRKLRPVLNAENMGRLDRAIEALQNFIPTHLEPLFLESETQPTGPFVVGQELIAEYEIDAKHDRHHSGNPQLLGIHKE